KCLKSSIFGVVNYYSTSKLRYFILSPLLFPEDIDLGIRHRLFQQSELGRIYQSIPFKKLADFFRDDQSLTRCGRKPFFSIEVIPCKSKLFDRFFHVYIFFSLDTIPSSSFPHTTLLKIRLMRILEALKVENISPK